MTLRGYIYKLLTGVKGYIDTELSYKLNTNLGLGQENTNKVLITNDEGDIVTSDDLSNLKNSHDDLSTTVSTLSTVVSTNTSSIETNAGNIKNNTTNITSNTESIGTINSSINNIKDILNQKVDKDTDLTPWAKYDGTVVKIGIDSSKYIESQNGVLKIHDGDKTTSWESGQLKTNQVNATEKVETKEVAIEGGLSLKHVSNDGWYLM